MSSFYIALKYCCVYIFEMRDIVLIIMGPTASGKTELAINIAQKISGEIISADSRQIYKGFVIGTAAPVDSPVPYHLVNFLEPNVRFNAMEFKHLSEQLIKNIISKGKRALIVGGTGLYIKALTGMFFCGNLRDENIRRWLLSRLEKGENLWDELKLLDPEISRRIHPNDIMRITRALEVYYLTGKPLSFFHKHGRYEKPPFKYKKFIIVREREELYRRINERVDQMICSGWVEEVKELLESGVSENAPAFESVGYKEIIEYLKGKMTLEQAIEKIKQRTRQYARRQIIWFKKEQDAITFNLSKVSEKEVEESIIKETVYNVQHQVALE